MGKEHFFSLPDPKAISPEILLELEFYTEGPVVDEKGQVYFTDLAGQCIHKYQNGTSIIWGKGKRPNGQALLKNGCRLVCDSSLGTVVKYGADGQLLEKSAPGTIGEFQVKCPNDIAVNPDAGFYFTDSVRDIGAVYFVGWNGQAKVLARNIDFPNGIVYQKERNLLLIAESYKNRILKLDLNKPPDSKDYQTVFGQLPFHKTNTLAGNLPDGLALDMEGRLWVAHYGMQAVQVLSPTGELLATYDSAIPLTSNLCFVQDELWITGGKGEPGPGLLARLKVGIRGCPLL